MSTLTLENVAQALSFSAWELRPGVPIADDYYVVNGPWREASALVRAAAKVVEAAREMHFKAEPLSVALDEFDGISNEGEQK